MSATPLLAVRGVTTMYGNITALRGVDLDVHQGEIVTLIGANGAGKSTLMMTIFGNPRASDGQILFEGRDITHLPTHEIARLDIAQSPEGRRIFSRMTVMENLQMGAAVIGCDAFRRGSRPHLQDVSAHEGTHPSARRHAVRRRAADARDRARVDVASAPVAARRAVARPRATRRQADFQDYRGPERTHRAHRAAGRTERLSRACGSPTAAMSWSTARSPCREPAANCSNGPKSAPPISKAAAGRRDRWRRVVSGLTDAGPVGIFILLTVILGGGTAFLTGRAIAGTWRPWWQVASLYAGSGRGRAFPSTARCSAQRSCLRPIT